LPLAEVAWRWSFGAAAFVLIGLGVLEFLDSLPVSPTDMLMLRTGHPLLIAQAIAHIFRETAPRVRKPIREFVMSGKWGHTADFITK